MALYRKKERLKSLQNMMSLFSSALCIFTTFYKQNLIIKRNVDCRYIVIVIDRNM